MANYRFYVLDSHDQVREPPQVFECPDDAAAVEKAALLLNGQGIEVWDHSRRVVRLKLTDKRHSALPHARYSPPGPRGDLYDSDDLRLLSAAQSAALGIVRKSAGVPLTEIEMSNFSERLAASLFRAFNSGERDLTALEQAALKGVLWASRMEVNGTPEVPPRRVPRTIELG